MTELRDEIKKLIFYDGVISSANVDGVADVLIEIIDRERKAAVDEYKKEYLVNTNRQIRVIRNQIIET